MKTLIYENKNEVNSMDEKALVQQAVQASQNAYCPYSGFHVGAALLAQNGEVFTGCNVENASFSATTCAERVALQSAVAAGQTRFVALAVFGEKSGTSSEFCVPCGVCLQVLNEFCTPDFVVLAAKTKDKWQAYTLKALLPHGFDASNLKG